jgi:enediyne biosynthesis protein E4
MVKNASPDVVPKKRRGLRLWFALGLIVLLLSATAGALLVRQRSLTAELLLAREALSAKRFGLARQRLARLAERWTIDGEVLFLLGNSELALGKRDDALVSWARVPASSPFSGRAVMARASRVVETGRYAPAESLLLEALADPSLHGRYDLERALIRVYRHQGRYHDVRPLIRASWCRAPQPALVLKELWGFDLAPKPVELLKSSLAMADKDDDRAWLGWANHAILTGQFAEASSWLERCLSRRPNDSAVWQAQLELALATSDVDGFWAALPHLPAGHFDEAEILAFRAWLAASNHDAQREEHELSSLIECDPGNAKALERLAVLNAESGRHREAEALHRRRDEISQAREKCRQILQDGLDVPDRAHVMAELSAKLGRTFDAQAWSILAEAGLGARGGDAPSLASANSSPLPASVIARANALSATHGIIGERVTGSGPTLSERIADLRLARRSQPGEGSAASEPASALGSHEGSPSQTIRAGAESKKSAPDFVDDTQAASLRFQLNSGHTEQHLLPETMSGGVGLIDFDGDGWLDVYCVQGGALSDSPGRPGTRPPTSGDRLFRNRGNGNFEEVTEKTGIARIAWGQGYGHGVAIGDYDNDGRPDLFVSRLMTYSLYRNQGNGTFEDVTMSAGLAGRRDHPTSAAWADLDSDGDLDLYVCHYMIWDPAHPKICQDKDGRIHYCHPLRVSPAPDHVFRNDGGRFVDVTASSGCAEQEGRGMGVIAADLDGDRRIDLFVANDSTVNYLWRNQGGFHFEDIGIQAGVGAGVQGGYQAGMGVACGDLDGDGRPDMMVTNFYGEGTTLFHNLGYGLFTDQSAASSIALATRYLLGFGIVMADVTNRGRLDVMITNGHVDDNRRLYPYSMPSRLYENRPDGRLVDVSDKAGECWKVERVGRGLAAGDLDNDGRVDALIVAQNEPLAYIHNRSQRVGHFVTFRLEGTKSNRDGVGASLTVTAGGRRQVSQRTGGGSYQSANDPRLHFGLGDNALVDSVEVHWPSGQVDRWTDLTADSGYVLREAEARVLSLGGFNPRPSGSRGR